MFRYAFITTTLSASTSFMPSKHTHPLLRGASQNMLSALLVRQNDTVPYALYWTIRFGVSSKDTSKFSTIKSIFFIAVILCCKLLLYTLFECRVHFLIQFPDTIHLSIDGSVGYCCTALLVTTVRFQQIVDFSSLRYILCSTNQFNLRQC